MPRHEDADLAVMNAPGNRTHRTIDLEPALSISQRVRPTLSRIEEDQLKAGLQQVIERIAYP